MIAKRLIAALPAVLAALAALLAMGGLTRGTAYGRYIAAQRLFEARTPALDGFVNGLRVTPGGSFDGLAYFATGGHYYLAEAPLLTWLALPLYGLGALTASLAPGMGWGPAIASLLMPLLGLALLLGVAAMARARGLEAGGVTLLAVAAVALTPLLPTIMAGDGWLLPAVSLVWLCVGVGARPLRAAGLGVLTGLAIGAQPWLAPAALMALFRRRQYWAWRLGGMAATLLPVAVWQQALFGRPWRTAAQFLVDPADHGALTGPAVVWLAALLIGLVGLRRRDDWWTLAVAILAAGGVALAGSDWPVALAALTGPAVWGWARLLSNSRGKGMMRTAGVALTVVVGLIATGAALLAGPTPVIAFDPAQRAMLAGAALVVGWLTLASSRIRWALGIGAAALAFIGFLPMGARLAQAETPIQALTPPFAATPASGGEALTLWRLMNGARIEGQALYLPDAQAYADSQLVADRPGERYCAAAGPALGAIILQWEDDGHHVLAQHGGPGPAERLCFAAPPGSTGVRLRLTGGAAATTVDHAMLWSDGPRLAPLPDYHTAALAFTFDWESAMGGLIHSKGGTSGGEGEGEGALAGQDPRTVAVERGLRMRQGAENLSVIFHQYDIKGTFYSTGYNLLTGNVERRTFAGDPIYRWASVENRWASDYWTTHRWYGDDPYATEETQPAWYFGSLTKRLAAEGHEIESHTFGHLYVRGTTPDELERDLREWNQAAEALGLPPARSFAFPWKSSNSVKAPHYERMVAAGITSLTRMYTVRPGAEFELDAVEGMPGLLIYPDQIIESNANGAAIGRRTIDEAILRSGYTSLWTHPEAIVEPDEVAAWRDVINYAAEARARGLWVTGLVEIVERVRAIRRVELVALRDGPATVLMLDNTAADSVDGVVAELPRAGQYVHAGTTWPDHQGRRVRAPNLPAKASVTLVHMPGRNG